ncbi:MAG: hypothetical protein AABX28_01265 [Nanoarchaeota archaeon]
MKDYENQKRVQEYNPLDDELIKIMNSENYVSLTSGEMYSPNEDKTGFSKNRKK